MWDPDWSDAGWQTRFEEPWRRLMVRLAVAGQLADSRSIVREQELTERMLDVITAAQQSSPVARLVLERQLRVDTRRAQADVPSDAREQLTRLARA
jgi:hypothetical protein